MFAKSDDAMYRWVGGVYANDVGHFLRNLRIIENVKNGRGRPHRFYDIYRTHRGPCLSNSRSNQ